MIRIFILFILITSCSQISNEVNNKDPKCDCVDLESPSLPIVAMGDSVVICDTSSVDLVDHTGKVSKTYKNKLELLSNIKGGTSFEKVYNCKNGQVFQNDFKFSSKYYQNKSLIIESQRLFICWDLVLGKKDFHQKYLPVYRKSIYAKNDSLLVSDIKMVFIPPFINQIAIQELDNMFNASIEKKDSLGVQQLWFLEGTLFSGALNEIPICRERFINFKKYFPQYDNPFFEENLKFLRKYENRKQKSDMLQD